MNGQPISKIIYCPNITLVTLPTVAHDSQMISTILTTISDNGINVDMISQSAPQGSDISISFTISSDTMGALLPIVNSLKPQFPELRPEVLNGAAKINFYDADMVNTPGVAAKVFSVLSESGIQVYMITTSTVDISILVLEHDLDAALEICREKFGVTPEEVSF
jgi:aspartokinase